MKTFCITLSETPDRRAGAEAEFARAGLDVTFYRGIHGENWGLRTAIEPTPGFPLKPGHIGLNLTHWSLWQHIWLSGHEEAIVFEDDATLCENFQKELATSAAALPGGWQFAFVGYCCGDDKPQHRVNDRVSAIHWPMCTHAYVVRRSALPILMDHCNVAEFPIDIQLTNRVFSQHKLSCWCFTPQLATQRAPVGAWVTTTGSCL